MDKDSFSIVCRHVEDNIGKVLHPIEYGVPDDIRVRLILVFPTEATGFTTIVTCGMSDKPMVVPPYASQLRYAELMICLPLSWPLVRDQGKNEPWPLRLLTKLARYPHRNQTWLSYGHTVPNGDTPRAFGSNTQFCAALLSVPLLFGDEMQKLRVNEDKEINFFTVIPIYQEELEFSEREGSDALLDRLDGDGVTEIIDISRRNVCAGPRFVN
jgi:hypothetical protein